MKSIFDIPFGVFLLTIVIPYQQWDKWGAVSAVSDAHRSALVLAVLVLAVMGGLRLATGSWRKAAAGAVVIPICLHALLRQWMIPAVVIGFILVLFAVNRRWEADSQIRSLNALSILSLVTFIPVAQAVVEPNATVENTTAPLGRLDLKYKPSIIHIVLDGYGGPETLREIYDLPVKKFHDPLRRQGFVVFEDVTAPYNRTLLSMASILSGGYLTSRREGETNKEYRRRLVNTIHHGAVRRIFGANGYDIAFANSGVTAIEPPQGKNVTQDKFRLNMLERKLLSAFRLPNPPELGFKGILMDALEPGIADGLKRPFHYYQHMLTPHPPFNVTSDGSPRETVHTSIFDASDAILGDPVRLADYIEGYRQKTLFTWKKLLRQLDSFPKDNVIIIIHGDHGPGAHVNHFDVAASCIKERLTTTLAVYTDDPALRATLAKASEQRFGLANLYRVILSRLSGAPIPILPAKSQYVQWNDTSLFFSLDEARIEQPCNKAG